MPVDFANESSHYSDVFIHAVMGKQSIHGAAKRFIH